MISRSALSKGAREALSHQSRGASAQLRAFASAASQSSSYEPSTITGVKVAARDSQGPTTRLAVVAKAGTRYQPLPGLTVGLEEYAFKNTKKRSALRITREAELLGGQLTAYHTREALVLQASFLRDDLPYFTELLAEIVSETKYTTFEYKEEIERVLHLKQAKLAHNAPAIALDAAHEVAFHTGLGSSLYPSNDTPLGSYLNEHSVAAFSEAVYNKANIALVADGATQNGLTKWMEPFFKSVPASASGSMSLNTTATKYYGGEKRTPAQGKNSMVIAFPGAALGAANAAENAVLVALLGGESNIKWTPGFSLLAKAAASATGITANTANYAYSDAGLLAIQITGSADAVKTVAEESVKGLKSLTSGSISQELLTKAIAKAKFDLLNGGDLSGVGIVHAGANLIHGGSPLQVTETIKALEGVTTSKLSAAAKALLESKASVAAVGDLHVLPYAEDLGLKV